MDDTLDARPSLEIRIDHPDRPGEHGWTLNWDGRAATVEPAPGVDAGDPDDWGIPYASPDYTDVWLRQAGPAYVVDQLLDGFLGGGCEARIVALHGAGEHDDLARALRDLVDREPECHRELRHFVLENLE